MVRLAVFLFLARYVPISVTERQTDCVCLNKCTVYVHLLEEIQQCCYFQ